MKKLSQEEFLKKCKKVHGDKYDYSLSIYVDTHTKVLIICPKHGKFFQTPHHHMNGRNCKLCGCDNSFLKRNHVERHPNINAKYWDVLKHNAKSRHLNFEISPIEVWNKYIAQNTKCALTGWDITFDRKIEQTASVDRIDSSKGYTKDNIQIVHKNANTNKYFIFAASLGIFLCLYIF